MKLSKEEFRDRVYACWLGKNIGGTLGGPLEGIMELLDVKDYTQEFVGPVENDDLDLQLLALHCVEQYGGMITTQTLAKEWLSHVHFQFDEYGHSLTNLRKGLRPGISGHYNNFFTDCMGSPIRSELWAVLCAGMPDQAAYYALADASVDHAGGEGVYGEIFFAVFESLAFENDDIMWLIRTALSYLPFDCATAKAVGLLLENKQKGLSWQENREELIREFGGENFTYAPINIAFTLMGLLYEEGFTNRLLTTTNCGYDTDCTCATIASMMGILYGSSYIDEMWTAPLGENILVSPPVNGFDAPKTIGELTERSLLAGKLVQMLYETTRDKSIFKLDYDYNREVTLLPEGSFRNCDFYCETRYGENHPAICRNGGKEIILKVTNRQECGRVIGVSAELGGQFTVNGGGNAALKPGEAGEFRFQITAGTEKEPFYPGKFLLTVYENGRRNYIHEVPFVLYPTRDWRIAESPAGAGTGDCASSADAAVRTAAFPDSRIPVRDLVSEEAEEFTAVTWLKLPSARRLRLIAVCGLPLSLKVDGRLERDCAELTVAIPAYHRAEWKKCTDLDLSEGMHEIEITVKKSRGWEDLYFYFVDPDNWFAADTECLLEIPEEGGRNEER